ncbi:YceI family protein [Trinickia mobilis]|uniref:YceI family protein n=1 Tax=Trinickia mobilis TaxID=2816356 RepID=UPI001A8E223E|nr:YceI family protein [Trinickia mobilis]
MKLNFFNWMLAGVVSATLGPMASSFAQSDAGRSTVIATSRQMNVPIDGKFTRFSAQVTFDPGKPTNGSASLSVETSSFDLGDTSYNEQARGKAWFDSSTYPNATFVSSAIIPTGNNQLKVTGKLTIKDKSQSVTVPVTVTQQGATQIFDGAFPIKRTQFDIGTGEWKDTSIVADEVVIKFHVIVAKK